MQFRVPQFIDMEDKIFGPFTLKQFAYMLGAGGFSFIIWTLIGSKIIAMVLIIPVAGLFMALAFWKVNERPFIDVLESAFKYYTGNKVYTWKQPTKENNKEQTHVDDIIATSQKQAMLEKANSGKLHDIALGLDVLDRNPQE